MERMKERFFIPRPMATGRLIDDEGSPMREFHNERGIALKWSGENPLPEVGQMVRIEMNDIGPAVVMGYFESDGYLGIMSRPVTLPKWYEAKPEDLDWQRNGIGCEFGCEISPLKEKPGFPPVVKRWNVAKRRKAERLAAAIQCPVEPELGASKGIRINGRGDLIKPEVS
jgi:hypothetical protein